MLGLWNFGVIGRFLLVVFMLRFLVGGRNRGTAFCLGWKGKLNGSFDVRSCCCISVFVFYFWNMVGLKILGGINGVLLNWCFGKLGCWNLEVRKFDSNGGVCWCCFG